MSLKNALETAREILEQHQTIEETYSEAEEMKKKKGTKAGGEDRDVEVTADGDGAKTADGVTPKISEPLEKGGLGKTTTGKLILNILQPDEGSVSLNTKQISYVPQKINIDWAIPLRVIDFMNITSKNNKSKIIESLELTGVDHLIYNNLLNLSGGEFQRVMIARAIVKKPELLILDEPVQGVDFNGEIKLYNLIKEISDKLKCGILLISHDIHFVMSSTDHVICLNGHVCCSGTPNDVAKNPAYIELFGETAASAISLYRHDHNHTHNEDGSISK